MNVKRTAKIARKLIAASVIGIFACLNARAEKSEVRIPKWDKFVEITGESVNLRMAPSIDGDKLAGEYFAKGEVAPLLGETADWAKVYYIYSPTQYVWVSKQFTRPVSPQPLPKEYRFTTYQTYGNQMLTYKFNGKPTNIVYSGDYPFATTTTWAEEPDLYKDGSRFVSAANMHIDWQEVMPQIIRTIPDECIYKYFRGEPLFGVSHNFRTDHETKEFGSEFDYYIYQGDGFYELNISALPTHDPDQLFLIAHSKSGIDIPGTDLLASMRYNVKTGKYSHMRYDLPGVVIDKLGLTYDIFADYPECQREARQSTLRHIGLTAYSDIPMLIVTGPELSLVYPIDTSRIEGYDYKTTVYYLWDGDKFVKMVCYPGLKF